MKAAVLNKTGKVSDLSKNMKIEEVPTPALQDNDVLIKIKCASLNHRDLWITKGMYSKIELPAILGSDCSGVVEDTGSAVKKIKPGDEVIVNPSLDWGDSEEHQSASYKILGLPDKGTLAEYVKINVDKVYSKPAHMSFEEASALPLCGLTAYRASFIQGQIKKGDNVLITGIGGGVATFLLLYCVSVGANVYVTSSSQEKIEKAVSLGAVSGVDYTGEDWDRYIKDVTDGKIDVVIDSSGGNTINKALEICRYGGKIVTYGASLGKVPDFNLTRVYWKQIQIIGSTMGSDKDFKDMLGYTNKKKIVPVVDKIFSLDNVVDAFGHMDSANQFGKIVVKMP